MALRLVKLKVKLLAELDVRFLGVGVLGYHTFGADHTSRQSQSVARIQNYVTRVYALRY